MALTDFLFGTPSETTQSLDPSQAPFLQDLYARAQTASQAPAQTQATMQGQEMGLEAGQNLSPFIQGAQQTGSFLMDPNLLSPESNPYLQQTAQAAINPIFQALSERILPQIRSGATGAGQFGGSRQGIAEGIASRGALSAAGNTMSDIFSRAYGQGLNTMGQGLSLAPQTASLGLLPSQVYRDIGSEQQNAPWQQLGQYSNLIGSPISTATTTGGSPGLTDLIPNIGVNIR